MSEDDKQIPGFYRDPTTGKYYKDDPRNSVFKRLKKKIQINSEFQIKPKITKMVHFLNAREVGTIGGVLNSVEYYKMKCFGKQMINKIEIDELRELRDHFDYTLTVNYIMSSDDSLYVSWQKEDCEVKSTLGALKFEEDMSHESWYFKNSQSTIVDVSEGVSEDHFIILYNWDFFFSCMVVEIVRPYLRSLHVPIFEKDVNRFCVSTNKPKRKYAFGCNRAVDFMDLGGLHTFIETEGRVHTISFDTTGNTMFSGLHTGNLFLHDLRSNRAVMNCKVSKSCLVDSSVLDSNHIIVAGVDDVLCNIDIRKNKVVTEYFTYKRQGVKKEPFSIANDLICAYSSDNKIKIWPVLGGFPIHEITPFEKPDNEIRGWLKSNASKTLLYYFEESHEKIFNII